LPDGTVDVDNLIPLLDDSVAGMMMTNPNTLGLFEHDIAEIAEASCINAAA
jgi:glycine dehydrogenase subunit 2